MGARVAPPCTQAILVVIFAWAGENRANFTRTPAWLHGNPPLLPQTTIVESFCGPDFGANTRIGFRNSYVANSILFGTRILHAPELPPRVVPPCEIGGFAAAFHYLFENICEKNFGMM